MTGFCIGIISLSFPIYICETIDQSVRGTLGLLPAAFGNFAIVLCFILGAYLDWVELAWAGFAISLPFIAFMFLIPETPIFYISKGKEEKAKESLEWLRGSDINVEPELQGMIQSFAAAKRRSSKMHMKKISKVDNMKPLFISLGLMFFQQFGGINALVFYTVQIFQNAGSSIDENLCVIIVGVVNLISSVIATALVDRLGRKILLYISSIMMSSMLMLLGSVFYFKDAGRDTSLLGWFPLSTFLIYMFGFSIGFGPIPFLM